MSVVPSKLRQFRAEVSGNRGFVGEILSDIRKRQNMYLLYRSNKIAHATYKRYSNYVTCLIRRSKKAYFAD